MLRTILAIAGRPGLYKLVNRGHNMLIVESLIDGKRTPAYSRDKVSGLSDISIYTDTEEVPLDTVLNTIKEQHNAEVLDLKALGNQGIKEVFEKALPEYDRDRVYAGDMKKVLQWYNTLIKAGITDFIPAEEPAEAEAEEAAEESK